MTDGKTDVSGPNHSKLSQNLSTVRADVTKNDAIKVKLRSRDHNSTNSTHACAEGSVTNLKMCYGESADNF